MRPGPFLVVNSALVLVLGLGFGLTLTHAQAAARRPSEGRGSYRDPSASSPVRISSAHYGSFCTPIISSCDPKFACIDNKCVCPSIKHQVYDKETAACRSLVGGPCSTHTHQNVDSGAGASAATATTHLCVANAVCTNKGYYEACECAPNYVENADGGCSLGVGSDCTGSSIGGHDPNAATCDASLICRNGKCDCADELEVYDFLKKKCRGVVGAACDPHPDPAEDDYCVEKAKCHVTNAKLRGRCGCVHPWDEWSDRFCERFENTAGVDDGISITGASGAGGGMRARYQTTEDPRQRLRQSTTAVPLLAPNYGGRYYRRRMRHTAWGATTTPLTPAFPNETPSYRPRPPERTTPSSSWATTTATTSTMPTFSLRVRATAPAQGSQSQRQSQSQGWTRASLTTHNGNGGGGGPGGAYVPDNCPNDQVSDCMYEDCKLTGCTDGNICCPKPCGGSWCVRGVR